MKTCHSLFLLIIFIVSSYTSLAQQEWKWLLGGGGENSDQKYAVTTGPNNIIYVAGGFRDQATIAGEVLTSTGDNDIFLAAFDTLGNKLWLVQEGGLFFEWVNSLVTDDNYLYVAGSFNTETIIGDDTLISNFSNTADILLAKYDLNGNFQWAKNAGGVQDDQAQGIALDDNSNIYITGPINHTAYFDDITVPWAGLSDIFIAKYAPDGDCIWAIGFGGVSYDYAFDIAVDNDNNLVVGGRFYETVQFGSFSLTSVHYADAFIMKCTLDGTVTWVQQAGGQYDDHMTSVAVDSENNYYTAGWYMGDISFGNDNHVSAGGMDIFLAKYNVDGTYQWSQSFGNMEIDEATALTVSSDDKVLMAGEFHLTLNLGSIELTAMAYYDGFIGCFNPDGSILWADQLKSAGNVKFRDGAVDQNGNYYAVGGFLDNIIAGTHQMNTIGGQDYFMANLGKASSGINDQVYTRDQIMIYPLPADEVINIRWPGNSEIQSLTLYNLVGQQVYRQEVKGSIANNHLQIPVATFFPGMYMMELKIKGQQSLILRKVIVQ